MHGQQNITKLGLNLSAKAKSYINKKPSNLTTPGAQVL